MFANPVQSLVPLQPHCRCISFNATAIVTSRFYGAKLYHLNLLLLVTAGSIVQECGFARFARYILKKKSPETLLLSLIKKKRFDFGGYQSLNDLSNNT
ncbi:unnamed protein product [Brassica napus]|uniref:(rape) hypothetical protein n=1 Tax=Brassica napus TaxID=3708 RepID=A0A816ILV3_BRANA|nr:unnamed protein product [Brassica napus]